MVSKDNIPKHVAVIMDGNGRWAKERGLSRNLGHREGFKRVKDTIEAAVKLGIKVITFFAFSSENWSRPKREVDALMRYLDNSLDRQVRDLHKNNIKLLVIGRREPLPEKLFLKLQKAQEKTKNNDALTVVLALNYGARQEIADAAKRLAEEALSGSVKLDGFDAADFEKYLYTAGLPDPDLLIRTSAEMRLSNFLLWQLSYAELYFSEKKWPDFRAEDLKKAIRVYQKRERRFGGVDAHKKNN